jgi:hypothetical protein
MFGGAFISCSSAVTWIDGSGYVVFPRGDVNGAGAIWIDDLARQAALVY